MSNFAESGGELAAVEQRLDYRAMSGYGTYEGANGATEVVSATLMYPFGGELTELSATDRYRFGGKEFDTRGGLFHYDFGARHYDPALCQFPEAEPLAEYYYPLSPNLYCGGNPILFIDPLGTTIFHTDRDGNVLFCEDDGTDEISIVVETPLDLVTVEAFMKTGGGGSGGRSWANLFIPVALSYLVGNDVTGFGVADDVLIPFVLGVAAVSASMGSNSEKQYEQITYVTPFEGNEYSLSYLQEIQLSDQYDAFKEHSKNTHESNWNKHSNSHSSKRYVENKNNKRGNNNKKYRVNNRRR